MRIILSVAATFLVLRGSALAQTPGDGNGDGLFTGADLERLESCWANPQAPPLSPCAVFDQDGDGRITLPDVLRLLGRLPTQVNDCGPPSNFRRYLGYTLEVPTGTPSTLYGVSADITVKRSRLCGDNATYGPFGFVGTYVSLVQGRLPGILGWGQVGFITGRNHIFPGEPYPPPAPNPANYFKFYVELNWDNIQSRVQPFVPGSYFRMWTNETYDPPRSDLEFGVGVVADPLNSARNNLFVYIQQPGDPDSAILANVFGSTLPTDAFQGRNPSGVTYTVETVNPGDHVPGRVFDPCEFTICTTWDTARGAESVDFEGTTFSVTRLTDGMPLNKVGIRVFDTLTHRDSFAVWDKRP